MEITGERFTPGHFPEFIEKEHLARYRFAATMVHGKRVADIACGTGYGTRLLAEAGATMVHGIDLSEEAVTFAKQQHSHPNIQFTVASAEKLTAVPNEQFDLVVSFETIEHLPNVGAYLGEMVRILRPGGQFVVSTPDRRIGSVLYRFRGRPENEFHVREYTEREFLDLLSSKFRVKACYGQAFISPALVFWPVQFAIKATCRLLRTAKARDFKDRLYSNQGRVEVVPKPARANGVAKYWVVVCTRC